ncbi:MAG: PilX N-terminal domain-containing pilus assembly protein [Thiohalomonadaceae bacterium]
MSTVMLQPRSRQHGAVLVVALVILLLLTILGVSGMQGSAVQERVAGNLKEQQRAFLAAEVGLRQGEQYVENNTPADPCTESSVPACGDVAISIAAQAEEVPPEYRFEIPAEPALREIRTDTGGSATGAKGGARKLYTAHYRVSATGNAGIAQAELRSSYAVPLF